MNAVEPTPMAAKKRNPRKLAMPEERCRKKAKAKVTEPKKKRASKRKLTDATDPPSLEVDLDTTKQPATDELIEFCFPDGGDKKTVNESEPKPKRRRRPRNSIELYMECAAANALNSGGGDFKKPSDGNDS